MDRRAHGASFAQSAARYVHQRESKRGGVGGWGFQFKNRFDPPKNTTTTFRFMNASYKRFDGQEASYYQFHKHFVVNNKRSFICSKIWEGNEAGDIYPVGGNCLGCDEMENGNKGVNRQLLHAFHGIHLVWFHIVPEEDRNGRVRTNKEGKPNMVTVPCKGRACELCRKKVDKIFGKATYFPIGTNHFKNLVGFAQEIEKGCFCGGSLYPVTYSCRQCGEIVLDVEDSELDEEGLIQWAHMTHKCPSCNQIDLPVAELECSNCSEPMPLSIFDVDMELKKCGERAQSTLQITRWTPRELPQELENLQFPDLNKVLAGTDTTYEAKCLGVEDPYKSRDAGRHAADYDENTADEPVY